MTMKVELITKEELSILKEEIITELKQILKCEKNFSEKSSLAQKC